MRHLPLILTSALLALPAHAQPTGFSTYDLDLAARTSTANPSNAQARKNAAHTETLRAAFALSPERGWHLTSTSEATVLHLAFGEKRPMGDEALQWFMRGAIGGTGQGNLTGLYNPIADVWLVLSWQTIGGTSRIKNAAFVPGLLLRQDGEVTAWTQKPGGLGDVLARQVAVSKASFATIDSDRFFANVTPVKTATTEAAFVAILNWMSSTRAIDDPSGPIRWAALHGRLSSAADKGAVSSLPARVRASMIPAGVTQNTDTTSVLLVSPLAPHVLVAADYRGKAKPELSLINLANGKMNDVTEGSAQ